MTGSYHPLRSPDEDVFDMFAPVIDPLTLPIVARCDAREAARREAQDRTDYAAYFTGEVSRRIHQRRLDCATLDAAVAWARGPVPDDEPPEAFGLRANIVRMAT